jgi:hypothetical protein
MTQLRLRSCPFVVKAWSQSMALEGFNEFFFLEIEDVYSHQNSVNNYVVLSKKNKAFNSNVQAINVTIIYQFRTLFSLSATC